MLLWRFWRELTCLWRLLATLKILLILLIEGLVILVYRNIWLLKGRNLENWINISWYFHWLLENLGKKFGKEKSVAGLGIFWIWKFHIIGIQFSKARNFLEIFKEKDAGAEEYMDLIGLIKLLWDLNWFMCCMDFFEDWDVHLWLKKEDKMEVEFFEDMEKWRSLRIVEFDWSFVLLVYCLPCNKS